VFEETRFRYMMSRCHTNLQLRTNIIFAITELLLCSRTLNDFALELHDGALYNSYS
jgi:hypothetical protein